MREPLQCPKCGQPFFTGKALYRHVYEEHTFRSKHPGVRNETAFAITGQALETRTARKEAAR